MNIKVIIDKKLADISVLINSPSNELADEICAQLTETKIDKTFTVKSSQGIEVIQIDEITLIEVFADEIVLSLIDGSEVTFRGRLYKIKEKLDEQQFVQISKSAIVNLRQIQKLEHSFSGNMLAILKTGKKQSISRRYLPELKKILAQLN
ncbi:LytTR family DNA-binding domain-containing protein [Candidatus Enterococcus huntleyi]|uniref:LytTR family DNA-binding domain-containing protein n=1 Tax=Candidatus Enterococcus huntleyi TaxID=1857217 RepID=UPI00137AAEF8|nr:LytTR family DNA-binding domain-containing protein [Enterococcus sp. JM4C]